MGDGSQWKRETPSRENVADQAQWPDLSLFGHLELADLNTEVLTVTVRDCDPDKFENIVGRGHVNLKQFSTQLGDWVDVAGMLHRESGHDVSGKKADGQFAITLKYVA